MPDERLERMRKLLKPITRERAAEIMQELTQPRVQTPSAVAPLDAKAVAKRIAAKRIVEGKKKRDLAR